MYNYGELFNETYNIRFDASFEILSIVNIALSFMSTICHSAFAIHVCRKRLFSLNIKLLFSSFLFAFGAFDFFVFVSGVILMTSSVEYLFTDEQTCAIRNSFGGLAYLSMTAFIFALAVQRYHSSSKLFAKQLQNYSDGRFGVCMIGGMSMFTILSTINTVLSSKSHIVIACIASKQASSTVSSIVVLSLLILVAASATTLLFVDKRRNSNRLKTFVWYSTVNTNLALKYQLSVNHEANKILFPQAVLFSTACLLTNSCITVSSLYNGVDEYHRIMWTKGSIFIQQTFGLGTVILFTMSDKEIREMLKKIFHKLKRMFSKKVAEVPNNKNRATTQYFNELKEMWG